MLEALTAYIGQHWFLSTYLSVMVLNESAILTAFTLAADQGGMRIVGVGFATMAGSFTNDIILYMLARYGFSRFFIRSASAERDEAVFERFFLKNVFFSLLFIKFLFGVRLFLTVYLVVKKQISFRPFALYDIAGVALYVAVVGGIGILIGSGNSSIEDRYSLIVRTISAVTISVLALRLLGLFLERWMRDSSAKPNKNSQAV